MKRKILVVDDEAIKNNSFINMSLSTDGKLNIEKPPSNFDQAERAVFLLKAQGQPTLRAAVPFHQVVWERLLSLHMASGGLFHKRKHMGFILQYMVGADAGGI